LGYHIIKEVSTPGIAELVPRAFYARPTTEVAIDLLGRHLVCVSEDGTARAGKIVETEAYVGPHDLACHAARGRTARTEVMFGPPGVAYVYFVYGMHHCVNAVTGEVGHASAVLIRALEPVERVSGGTNGPGRLCKALGIDRSHSGVDLTERGRLFIEAGERPVAVSAPAAKVANGPRIGVAYAEEWAEAPYRYWIEGNTWVSRR
jgi:DNA-3-methyladenine glycosylase